MKNTAEKKINWKKVAAFGGMFVAGVVVGVVGGEKVLNKLADGYDTTLSFTFDKFEGKKCLKVAMRDDRTGRTLWIPYDKRNAKYLLEGVPDMIEQLD